MINKNQECDIISDLLPLYLEYKTSEETGEFIREHLQECECCRKNLEFMDTSYEELFTREKDADRNGRSKTTKKRSGKRNKAGRKIFGNIGAKLFLFAYLLLLLGIWIFIVTSFMEML